MFLVSSHSRYDFESWREYSYLDEEDKDTADRYPTVYLIQ